MTWNIKTVKTQRLEFVQLAQQKGVSFKELCRRHRISPKTGYKWLKRYAAGGEAALADRSRRPKRSPQQCPDKAAQAVIELRQEHPAWGGRKLRRRLQELQHTAVPAASTCTQILRRAELISAEASAARGPFQRFERAQPNELWQMDFKGHFGTQAGVRCHPLTVLDDHSRFNLLLSAEADETGPTVQRALQPVFEQHGLPDSILSDNGPPWGHAEPTCPYTTFTVWLLRYGVTVRHGRAYHPQTQGKEERFHRTLREECLAQHTWRDLAHCAAEFPRFRHCYNHERPHEALGGATPATRYRPSPRSFPSTLPPIEYPAGTAIHLLPPNGRFMFGGQTWYVGWAFGGQPIGLRPSAQADGLWQVFFCHHPLGLIDLTAPRSSKHSLRSIYATPAHLTPLLT